MKKIFDLLWPRAEPDSQLNPSSVFQQYYGAISDLALSKDHGTNAKLLEFSRYLYDDQERKWQTVLARASPTLSTAGLGLALFGVLANFVGGQKDSVASTWMFELAMAAPLVIALVYLLGALIDCLRVYGPTRRYLLDPTDLVPLGRTEDEYLLALSRSLMNYATENFKVQNRGVALVSSSQRRLRNGFVLLAFVALLVLGIHVASKMFPSTINCSQIIF
jgi:hypothetical protein